MKRLIRLTNAARRDHSHTALAESSLLNASAQARAKHLAKTGILEHGTWWKAIYKVAGKTRFSSLGENIAEGQDSTEQTLEAWMQSPPHRANILGNYTHMGVGYAKARGREYRVQHFGRR